VLRLANNFYSSGASGVWRNMYFRFDKDLYNKIDFGKSGYYKPNDLSFHIFASSAGEYEKYYNLADLNTTWAAWTNQVPIEIVMNEGVTYESLNDKDYFIQARLTDAKGEKVYTYAPRGTKADYMTYTRSTIIPFKSQIEDIYQETSHQASGGPFVMNKTFAAEYDPFYGKNTVDEDPSTALMSLQYNYTSREALGNYNQDGRNFGLLLGFDKKLAPYIIKDETNPGQSIIGKVEYRDARKLPINEKNWPTIKYENLIVEGDMAYVAILPNNWKVPFTAKNILGGEAKPVYLTSNTLYGYFYNPGGGLNKFINLNIKIDNDEVINKLHIDKINYVTLNEMGGFIQENPGWTTYEYTADEDMTIPKKGKLDITLSKAMSTASNTNYVTFRVGGSDALARNRAGYYVGTGDGSAGIEKVENASGGTTQIINFLGGQKIRKGDKIEVIFTHDPNYDGEVLIWNEPEWNDEQNLKLSRNGQWNIFGTLDKKIASKMTVKYKDLNGMDKIANATLDVNSWKSDSDAITIRRPLYGDFTLNFDYIYKSADVDLEVTYKDGSVKTTTIHNKSKTFTRKEEVYTKPYFINNSQKLGFFVVNKAAYMPTQDVFTNDYSKTTTITDTSASGFKFAEQLANKKKLENFNPFRDNFDVFMKDTVDIRGYSLYQNGTVAKMLVPKEGGKIEAYGIALEDEVVEDGNNAGNLLTDMSTKITHNGKDYLGWLYDIKKPAEVKLVKDLKLLFSNTTSSSLLSDWKTERVRTRVLFDDNKDFDFDYKTNNSNAKVKIVPDAEKYYQEADYKVNGFSEESGAKFVDDSGKALTGDELAVRQWPGNLKAYTDDKGQAHKFIGWASGKVDSKEYAALPELTKVEQWNDGKVYKVTPDSPIDTHQVVYAVWGDGLKINLHANNGTDTVYQIDVLAGSFKEDQDNPGTYKAIIDIPAVPYWNGGTTVEDETLKKFINSTPEGENKDPRHTFVGWAAKADEKGLKIGYNLNDLVAEDNGLDADQIDKRMFNASTIINYNEEKEAFESTNILLPNNHELILEGTYEKWANMPDIDLYAHYRPFFNVDVTNHYMDVKDEDSKNPSYVNTTQNYKPELSIGLLYSANPKDYTDPTIKIDKKFTSFSEGDTAMEGIEGFKMQTVPEDSAAKFTVPGYDRLGQRISYIAVDTAPGNENAYYNFDGSWGKLGVSIYGESELGPIDPANNSKRIPKLQMTTVPDDGNSTIDAFSGATVRTENLRNNASGSKFDLTGYSIDMYNVPRAVPKPIFETVYDGDNSFKLNANGIAGGVTVDAVKVILPDSKVLYFVSRVTSDGQSFIPMVENEDGSFSDATGNQIVGTLKHEQEGDNEYFVFTYNDNSSFRKDENIQAIYYKGGLTDGSTGDTGSTVVVNLPTNAPVDDLKQLPNEKGSAEEGTNILVSASITKEPTIGTEYLLVKENGDPILDIDNQPIKYVSQAGDLANKVIKFPTFNSETNRLKHGDRIKVVTTLPSFKKRGVEDVYSELTSLILEGPLKELVIENDLFRRWMDLGIKMESEDHVAVGKFKVEILFKDGTQPKVIDDINSTEELNQTLRELYRDDNIDRVTVVASDKFGNENKVEADYDKPLNTPISLITPRAGLNYIFIKGENNAFVTINVIRNGEKVVTNQLETLSNDKPTKVVLKENGITVKLKKGDIIDLKSVIYENNNIDGKVTHQSNPSRTTVR
jgi:hypothetical protein